jgi:soluble lytic murein transglycosylase-like protein
MISHAIYASADTESLPQREFLTEGTLCSVAADKAGAEYGVGYDLLQTISVVESGRFDKLHNQFVSWPWTVNANGKGYYYSTKEEAVAAVKNFQKEGITSIDVGCMQINLKYHGEAFSSIEEALNPEDNVRYSAKFLRKLYNKNGYDWKKAAKRYHSGNHEQGEIYSKRLEKKFSAYKLAGLTRSETLF